MKSIADEFIERVGAHIYRDFQDGKLTFEEMEAALESLDRPEPLAIPGDGYFAAYDLNRFDVCADPGCKCRQSRNNIRGTGKTAVEAIADFWEQWNNA